MRRRKRRKAVRREAGKVYGRAMTRPPSGLENVMQRKSVFGRFVSSLASEPCILHELALSVSGGEIKYGAVEYE